MTHEQIRQRDRNRYGVVPVGYTIHHIWYSEEYDPNSFVVITPEEHAKIHGRDIVTCSEGFDKKEYMKDYNHKYDSEHKESRKEYNKKYYEEHKEELRESSRKRANEYYKRKKYREKLIKMGVI